MSDETDTTSEVARVLIEHTRIDGIHGDCLCKHVVPLGHSFAAHQAAMLAEAGLLRRADTDHLAEDLRENTEALMAARARLADLTARIGFGDGVTEPQADNDAIVKAVNEAFTNSNTLWEVEEQVERVRALADHYEARQGTALGRVSTGNVAASIRRALGPQEAQIATQEPAGATQGGSGDSRASGGSCARCGAGITLPANDPENREMAVCAPCEITVLKEGYGRARAQVERVRAQCVRMTKSSDEKTQRHGNALLHILDGEDTP